MQFYVPIPWPLALFFLPFFLMARGIIWLARRAWPHLLYSVGWLWGYHKTKFLMLRSAIAQRRAYRQRVEKFKRDVDAVGREVEEYCAGRVIDGECRQIEDKQP